MWLLKAVRNWRHRRRADAELDEELHAYVDLLAADKVRAGASPSDAARLARIDLGGLQQVKEQTRDIRAGQWLEALWQDLRFGARMLRKSPAFSLVAILTLALGIGANTAIFSVLQTVLFQPLPFPGGDRVVRVYSTERGARLIGPGGPSPLDMRDLARANHTFEAMAIYDTWPKNVTFAGASPEPQQIYVGLAPRDYFVALGLTPIMGRLFTAEESYEGKHYVAAISTRIWRDHYASDPHVLGKTIRINDEPYTIVAVLPDKVPEWMDSRDVQIWTPFGFADALNDLWTEVGRAGRGWYSIGLLKPGVSLRQAQADLATVAASLAVQYPVDKGIGVDLERLSEARGDKVRSLLWLLMAAVTFILLIACVNLANLLLARNSVRQRELAMRAALGARRGRLARQLLAETLLLSLFGGAAGLVLAKVAIVVLSRFHPRDLPQLSTINLDARVLAFALLVSLLTSVLFGLGPALAAGRLNLVESLKLGGRSLTAGSHTQRLRSALVVAEMAMSLMLLVGAGLLLQSIARIERQPLGVRHDHLLMGHLYLPPVRYPDAAAITRFCDEFGDRVRSLPGVEDASLTTISPPDNGWTQMLGLPGRAVTPDNIPEAEFGLVDAHFLKTMGIPLLRGRDFAPGDTATSLPVALVSQEFVRRYFPAQDPIGQTVHLGPPAFMNFPPGAMNTDVSDVSIVGIFGDFRNDSLLRPPKPQILVPISQHPLVNYGFKRIVVRTRSDPYALSGAIQGQLYAIDPDLPFARPETIDDIVARQTGSRRFTTLLLGLFAGTGLLLALVGIYGVVSFLVAQRRSELAVRVALGATSANIVWLVLRGGLLMAGMGAALGLAGAWAGQALMRSMLYGISPVDLPTFAVCTAFLVVVVLAACWTPAARASRVDPCIALRAE